MQVSEKVPFEKIRFKETHFLSVLYTLNDMDKRN